MSSCFHSVARSLCRCALVVFLLTGLAHADEAGLRAALQRLAAPDATARRAGMLALAHTGDPRAETALEQYRLDSLYLWQGTVVRCDRIAGGLATLQDALTGAPLLNAEGHPLAVLAEQVAPLSPRRADRKYALTAISLTALASPESQKRQQAARKCGAPPRQEDALDFLTDLAVHDPVRSVRHAAEESIALIHLSLATTTATQRIAAAETLGRLHSPHGLALLNEAAKSPSVSAEEARAFRAAMARIDRYGSYVKAFDSLKFGLSSGSVLILMALGLSITFGLMGVINMAHGELMMVGAYATYCMQLLFGHTAEQPNNWYFLAALPVSFLASALVGLLMEVLVVRHLYRRPLESLLATYGVSLVLIQTWRVLFGDNRACSSPTWLVGNVELLRDMSLSWNRVFVFGLALACLPLLHLLMTRTPLGLHMRATMQNRHMASALGVNTRRVDQATFMLGSGLAGVAGYALTTIGGITPDMGQNYIVDSFLVVVTGGVGQLLGVVCSGLGLGLLAKLLEGTFFGTVWAKIIVLSVVIVFIQYRPSGLFAPRGRLADE